MNIFDRDNIDWQNLTARLLWYNIIDHKNEYSGYDIITNNIPSWCKDKPEEAYQRGYKPGDIISDVRILSYWVGPTRQLTWKELTLALGFWKKNLLPDYHDCSICNQRKDCHAYFKDNPDQERCSGWIKEYGCPDEETEYKKFIDNLLNGKDIGNLIIDFTNASEDELNTLATSLNITLEELKDIINKSKES